jgi:hypothetical protein
MDQATQPVVTLNRAVQVGMVVKDIERTMALLSRLFGIGPFRQTEWPIDRPDMKYVYRGVERKMRMKLAFASLGPVELELIQPLEGESDYKEFLASHGDGLHHILFDVPNMDEITTALAGEGIGVLQTGTGLRPGTRWAYLDTAGLIGFNLEMRQTVPGSDGTSPIPPPKGG